ncbi:MAG: hypothetical protein JWN89_706 [Parcubacteria group bacterium]|nr:hypothetical protein [Parcubacteria group bacterium]
MRTFTFDSDPTVRVEIVRALKNPGDMNLACRVAQRISDRYLKGHPLKEAVALFGVMCIGIDDVKCKSLGHSGSTSVSNHIMKLVATYYVRSLLMVTQADLDLVEGMKNSPEFTELSWMQIKFGVFHRVLLDYWRALDFAMKLSLPDEIRSITTSQVVDEMRNQSLALLEGIVGLRKYGLKSCYFEDGMCHAPGDVWVFTNPNDYRIIGNLPSRYLGNDILGVVNLAKKDAVINAGSLTPIQTTFEGMTVGVSNPFLANFMWSINGRGDVHAQIGNSELPVREIFERLGKEAEFATLLFANSLRLYDLLVPVEVVATMPTTPRLDAGLSGLVDRIRNGKVQIVDLMVPRLRTLDQYAHLELLAEKEFEEAVADTNHRAVRKHEVEAFVRRLPKGRHPTKAARDLAWKEQGIVLSDSETYVRKHERGEGKLEPVVHRARSKRVM